MSWTRGFEEPRPEYDLGLAGSTLTPRHASWLNMAEIEFSVLTRDCFGDATATM